MWMDNVDEAFSAGTISFTGLGEAVSSIILDVLSVLKNAISSYHRPLCQPLVRWLYVQSMLMKLSPDSFTDHTFLQMCHSTISKHTKKTVCE